MPNPVLPLIPWAGGLNRKQNPSLADASQLVVAEDVVYNFDGTRHKRGGQSHRNRIAIPGGEVDSHFSADYPAEWTAASATGTMTMTLVNGTEWRANTAVVGFKAATQDYAPGFKDTVSVRVRIKPVTLGASDLSYFGFFLSSAPSTATAGDPSALFSVRISGNGIILLTSNGTNELIGDVTGTFSELAITASGSELYETDEFHTWRFDHDPTAKTVTIYFDEALIWTSGAIITNTTGTAEDATVTLEWNNPGGFQYDFYVDDFSVTTGNEESVVQALFDFPRVGVSLSTAHRMIATVNGRVYQDPGDHRFRAPLLEQDISSPLTLFDFASFKDRLIIARSGGQELKRWDPASDTAITLPGDPPKGSILRVHKNRLWVAGDEDEPSRLYWSALLNDEEWTTASAGTFTDSGFVDVESSDGGIITGLGPSFRGQLIIYKTTGIFRLTGTDEQDFFMESITRALGGVGHHAIVNVGNDQFFISPKGVHSLVTTEKFGDLEESFLSNDIRELWNDKIQRETLKRAWAVNNEDFDRYEILIPFEGGALGFFGNRVLCFHYGLRDQTSPLGKWSMKIISGGSMAMFFDDDGKKHSFIGGTDGFVNRQDERYCHDFPTYSILGSTSQGSI